MTHITYRVGDFVKLTGAAWSAGEHGLEDYSGRVVEIRATNTLGDGYITIDDMKFWVDGDDTSRWHGEVVGHHQYVATINTPGYLPWADEPAVFDSIREAWEYLESEYQRMNDTDLPQPDDYEETLIGFTTRVNWDQPGNLYANTPGYEGDHDLGLVFSVNYYENEEEL